MKEKKTSRSKKSPEELLQQHKNKVSHEVVRIDEWCAKLQKSLESRKYPLTTDEMGKVKDAIDAIFMATLQTFEPKVSSEEAKFRL